MATFTVWKFDDPGGARRAAGLLDGAATDGSVRIVDHAVVTWPEAAARPESDHSDADPEKGGLAWGALWGVAVGALLTVPVVGGVVGAATGARGRGTGPSAISREDLARIRSEVTPGSSALFLVTDEGDVEALGDRFGLVNKTLIHSSVST